MGFLLAVIATLALTTGALATDFSGWLYKAPITFSGYNRSETLTNFPALVIMSPNSGGFSYAAMASPANGGDLRFSAADGVTELNYEIDTWTNGGTSYVWVQVPALADSNSLIYAYWGNKTQLTPPGYTTNGATWTNGYAGVFHMKQTNIVDSSYVMANGTNYGSTNAVGQIGTGQGFGSGTQTCGNAGAYIALPSSYTGYSNFPNGLTLSAWIYPTSTNAYQHFLSLSAGSGLNTDVIKIYRYSTTADLGFNVFQGSSPGTGVTTTAVLQTNFWQHVVVTESASGNVTIYYNGSVMATGTTYTPNNVARHYNWLGKSPATGDYYYGGLMDEVSVSTVTRSSNWVWACYMNQVSNTAAFQTYGSAMVAGLSVSNLPPGSVNNYGGWALNGSLSYTGSAPVTVVVYWGPTDGGTAASAWSNATPVSVAGAGPFAAQVSGLPSFTRYYYRCFASNATAMVWASASSSLLTAINFGEFSHKLKISYSGYNKPETLTNFPALVVLSTNIAAFKYSDFVSPNGYDLRFIGSNMFQTLNYEIDTWNTNGLSCVWVQVPTLASSNDYIWAYYGSPTYATAPAPFTTNGATWANGYQGVFHMNQTNVVDSSCVMANGSSFGNTNASGWIGTGQGFGSGTQTCINAGPYIALPSSYTGYSNFPNGLTLSAWIYPTIINKYQHFIFLSTGGNSEDITFCNSNTTSRLFFNVEHTSIGSPVTSPPILQTNVWQHVVATESASGAVTLYYNGSVVGTGTTTVPANTNRTANWIGKSPGSGDNYFGGLMDEARVSMVARSSNWVWACYMNQVSNTAMFQTYSAAAPVPPPSAGSVIIVE